MKRTTTMRAGLAAALVATAAAACTPLPPTVRQHVAGSPAPSNSPSPTPALSASPSPLPSVRPSVAAPTPTPLPSPPASLAPAHASLRDTIESKLLAIAKVSFTQGRGQLAASGSLVGDAGGALLGNHAAGVISNNSGSIVANNGGGYHLLDGLVEIWTTAKPGETQVASRLWPDGRNELYFTGPNDATRHVFLRNGQAVQETSTETLEKYPTGAVKRQRIGNTEVIADGKVQVRLDQVAEQGTDGQTARITIDPGSVVLDLVTGAEIRFEKWEDDLVAGTASFRLAYGVGLVEEGTLANVKADSLGQLVLIYWDPLANFGGESRTLDAHGKLLFTRKQATLDGKKHRDYDLGDGLTMALVEGDAGAYSGTLSQDGKQQAAVKLANGGDGSSVFTVTFPEEPDHPLVIGYGLADGTPAATPKTPPQWVVLTVAGSSTPGYAEGTGDVARFNQLHDMVAGRANREHFFIADGGNHRVRLMTRGPLQFASYAGDGTPGHADGPAATASFVSPYGLAVGPDDTLYVSDQDDHRIRKIAPNGTVSTLAGDGTAGFVDGPGASARFNTPTGVALDVFGNLYVADALNHAIRMVDPDGNVTTVAGDGTKGLVDGANPRFNIPIGLLAAEDGSLYIADRDNNLIRKRKNGVVSTVAGTQDQSRLYFDGPALKTRFNPPHNLAQGPDGKLYFTTAADVYTLESNGEVHSYAGSAGRGYDDGVNFRASFYDQAGLCFSTNNVMYLVDGNRIRGIVPHL